MAIKFKDLKHKASPERRERKELEALAEFEEMERIRMGFIRASRKTTQVELAEQMQVPQSSISRLEGQNDCHLSTLRKYVSALGGRLKMRAVFPDKTIEFDGGRHFALGTRSNAG